MENNNLFLSLDKIIEEKKDKPNIIKLNIIIKDNKVSVTIKIIEEKKDEISDTENNILDKPEWRYYGYNDTKSSDPTRCGLAVNPLLPDSSVGTTIKPGYYTKTMNKTKRMVDWNSMTYKERSLNKIFNEIQTICNKNFIPAKISQESKSLYKIMSENKISRGNNRIGIIAACIYFACKNCDVPRSAKEISVMFDINNIIVTKGCKKFQEILHYNKINRNRINRNIIINSNDFIDRFCDKLNMNNKDIINIKKISDNAQKYKIIYENTPPSIAVGSIYLYIRINKLDVSKKEISNISKISEVTINKCYKKLEEHIEKLLN
jgi:transcription initiation factor TFIIB